MFMVCVEFMGKSGRLLASSCRSTMLHYKGMMLDTLYKLIYSPFFVFGRAEEKQNVQVELFSEYEEREVCICIKVLKNINRNVFWLMWTVSDFIITTYNLKHSFWII